MFSQGCKMEGTKIVETGEHSVPVAPSVVLNSQLTLTVRFNIGYFIECFVGD